MSNQDQRENSFGGDKGSGADYLGVRSTAARMPSVPNQQSCTNFQGNSHALHNDDHRRRELTPFRGGRGRGSHRGRGWYRRCQRYGSRPDFQRGGEGRRNNYQNGGVRCGRGPDYYRPHSLVPRERHGARFSSEGNRDNFIRQHSACKKRNGHECQSYPTKRLKGPPHFLLSQMNSPGKQIQARGNDQARVKIEGTPNASNCAPMFKSCMKKGDTCRIVASNQAGKVEVKTEGNDRTPNASLGPNSSDSYELPRSKKMLLETMEREKLSKSAGRGGQEVVPATKTHVIFAIDFSGSMKERDVKTSDGKVSRWEAVFTCIDSFLTQQVQQEEHGQMSHCLVSVFIFNDQTQVILKRMPLIEEGNDIRQVLQRAKTSRRPNGGTGFSAAFQRAEQLAYSNVGCKVVLVFLSDGRPGDLRVHPPSDSTIEMQGTFKCNGAIFPAAGTYISNMQKKHSDFSLQLICLCNEGVSWLKYLANRYNGTFHNPDLTLGDSDDVLKPCPSRCPTDICSGGDKHDILEVHVKSVSIANREKHDKARDSGEVISLTNMSTSSMRTTFSSISATVTAMRSGMELQERQVTIKKESAMISYKATRMVLMKENGLDKFIVAPGENANGRRIEVSMHPFAQGGLRNVYHMKQENETHQVAKESRHSIQYRDRLKFHLETVKCQTEASLFASYFNDRVNSLKKIIKQQKQQQYSLVDVPPIDVLRAEVYRLKAPRGGFRYLAVEEFLEGTYDKWNNNDGFVNKTLSDSIQCKVAQAFSHFSYESSEQQKMVVDIQGTGYVYTDPQLHSVEKEFGRADKGTAGFDKFFKTHKCNFICKELGLQSRSPNHICGCVFCANCLDVP